MKRALVVVVLLGLSSHARADGRDNWQAAFAGSVTVAIGGVITWWHGANKVSEAEDRLCAGGAYPSCRPSINLTPDDVDRLNAKGNRGETIAKIGIATTGIGLAVAGVALYKGFFAKGEEGIVVTPTLSRDGAGAALSLRF
jgi:hypothetical protein